MTFAIDDLTTVIAHWSADQITGLSDGDPVDTLPDSISSWNLLGTTTTRPLYRPTSSINSLPAVEFDGTDDYLATSGTKVISAGPICAISVIYLDVLKNFNAHYALHSASGSPVDGGAQFMGFTYSSGAAVTRSATAAHTEISIVAATTKMMMTDYLNNRFFAVTRNGASVSSTTIRTGIAADFVGGTMYATFGRSASPAFFDGLLAELVIFRHTVLSEPQWIEGVLAHKYGITLPTSHPFYAAAPTSGPPTGGGTLTIHPLRYS